MSYPFQSLGYAVQILGSSNGLVCLMLINYAVPVEEELFCVWNPATREYQKITKHTDEIGFGDILMYAFGYDHKSDDYKLVIGVGLDEEAGTAVYVYTLESDPWKSVITLPCYFCSYYRSSGVLVNGNFHFLAERMDDSWLIVSLDIIEETFKEIELSVELKENGHWLITEAVFQGCLCVFLVFRPLFDSVGDDHYPGCVELWVMQDYGVQKSWTKRYTITHEIITGKILDGSFSLRFISSYKNAEILLLVKDKLILYDPKDGSVIEGYMGSMGTPGSEAKYFESLVSVNSGTYVVEGRLYDSIDSEDSEESIDSKEA